MKVLIACEFSGIVRDEFLSLGHDAISCDLLPTEKPGPHVMGDVIPLLSYEWDLIIAHPPCTYLANSGVRWLYGGKGKNIDKRRWQQMIDASNFFHLFKKTDCQKVCIENPIPHKFSNLGHYDQIIHPWQFGHGETKATCLWLKGLPKLKETNVVCGREPRTHYVSPGPNRSKIRSRSFTGIAKAMAAQWGSTTASA